MRKVLLGFKSGDFSWLNSGFRHYEKIISEDERKRIVEEMSESSLSLNEAVSIYGFPEDTLRRWKRNYNEYGVCFRKKSRPPGSITIRSDTPGRRPIAMCCP